MKKHFTIIPDVLNFYIFVKKIISSIKTNGSLNKEGVGLISELKSLSAFDKNYQLKLKDYIDDLIYALYFKIKLPKLGFDNAEEIKTACSKHKFYQLINSK